MQDSLRREFIKQGVARSAMLTAASYAKVHGACERIVVGVIGSGRMGMDHIRSLATQTDIHISHVCDPGSASGSRRRRRRQPQKRASLTQLPTCEVFTTIAASTPSSSRRRTTGTAPPRCYKPMRQARLRRKAMLAQHSRRPSDDRSGAPAAQDRAGRHAEPIERTRCRGDAAAARRGDRGDPVECVRNSQLGRDVGRVQASDLPEDLDS